VKPWRDTAFLEGRGVLMGILLLHRREARDTQVREVLAVGSAAMLVV
jgi:hypothetical protein